MLQSLNTGVSGLQAFQQDMDVIGNNIANVSTVAFKSSQATFADTFSLSLAGGSAAEPVQVGTGVGLSAVTSDFTQQNLMTTNIKSNLAIKGESGFFLVKDTQTSSEFVTRDGRFHVDANGFLVNQNGDRVQGYTDAAGTTIGDLRIDNGGQPGDGTPPMQDFSIASDGKITVMLNDGTSLGRGQVLLQNVNDPQALQKVGDNLYTGWKQAGPLAAAVAPGTLGVTLVAGQVEGSNVDLSREFASMITAQRAFQANARVITTSDEILQELVNLKR